MPILTMLLFMLLIKVCYLKSRGIIDSSKLRYDIELQKEIDEK